MAVQKLEISTDEENTLVAYTGAIMVAQLFVATSEFFHVLITVVSDMFMSMASIMVTLRPGLVQIVIVTGVHIALRYLIIH